MSAVKSVQIVTKNDIGVKYEVGSAPEGGTATVGSIRGKGLNFPNKVDWCFEVYDEDNKLMVKLMNCPVEVKYMEKSKQQS